MEWLGLVLLLGLIALVLLAKRPTTRAPGRAVSKADGEAGRLFQVGMMMGMAKTVFDAYTKVLIEKHVGELIPESRLPASREAIQGAILLHAVYHQARKGAPGSAFDALQIGYGRLADFQPDEVAEKENQRTRLMFEVWGRLERGEQLTAQQIAEETSRIRYPREAVENAIHEFGQLCGEFHLRLAALDDPERRTAEFERIREALSGGQ